MTKGAQNASLDAFDHTVHDVYLLRIWCGSLESGTGVSLSGAGPRGSGAGNPLEGSSTPLPMSSPTDDPYVGSQSVSQCLYRPFIRQTFMDENVGGDPWHTLVHTPPTVSRSPWRTWFSVTWNLVLSPLASPCVSVHYPSRPPSKRQF